jgi:Protein of unknown function (DUF3891)
MIIHRPGDGKPLVVTQDFHLNLAAQFARHWGNERFADPEPLDILRYLARNHDAGWPDFDWDPPIDPDSGLPQTILTAAPEKLAPVHLRNVTRNHAFHPYAGLLSAMHIKGFFTSRLGMSEFVIINDFRERFPDVIEPLIAECEARIEQYTEEVAANPEWAPWLEPDRLWANYRTFQIYDQLSLYFCLGKIGERIVLTNAPVNLTESADLTIEPDGNGGHTIDPYPLDEAPLRVVLDYRDIDPPMTAPLDDMLDAPIKQLEFEVRPAA